MLNYQRVHVRKWFAHESLMKKILHVLVLIVLASATSLSPADAADNPPRKILTGWIPYYGIKNGLATAIANQDLIKEVSPFWYTVKNESTITDLYSAAKLTDPMSVPLGILRNLGYQIIPTITDGTDKLVLSEILGNESRRAALISTITTLVLANNFDGIDLDFENFAFVDGKTSWPTTKPRWIQFVKELSGSLHQANKLLFITSPVDFDPKIRAGGYSVYAWSEIAPYIDRLRIMTYDYSTSAIGPIGPLPWVRDAITYAISVIPASKVFIGVPGYGRDWVDSVSGTCPVENQATITTKAKAATFVMRDAANLAASYGATPTYRATEGEMTFTYSKTFTGQTAAGVPTTCTAQRVAWYQDSRSYVERAKLVAQYRLGGIVLWTMGMEDAATMPAVRAYAQTIAPDVVISSVLLDKSNTQFGDQLVISAQSSLPDKQPIAHLPIYIERKSFDGSWQKIYTGATDSSGKVSVSALFGYNTSLRVGSDGSWERLASLTPTVSMTVSPLIELRGSAVAARGKTVTLNGSMQPRAGNVPISLEVLRGGTWKKVDTQVIASSALTDSQGNFTILINFKTTGFATVRATSSSTDTLASAVSAPLVVVIK